MTETRVAGPDASQPAMRSGANIDVSQPLRDLCDTDDVAEMVRRFYRDVAQDDLLGPMFNDVAHVDWSEHLPKLTAFWCRALFGTVGYAGNPFRSHQLVHARQPFTAAHFERWLDLFYDTIEHGWTGPNADKVKSLAGNVARVHSQQLVGKEWDRTP
jgi:hemoglobin